MDLFAKSEWIWVSAGECADQYAEFCDILTYAGKCAVEMRLSCDSDYVLYINGSYVSSNQYGDYEHYKIYDVLDITPYLHMGENSIGILVYHCGVDTSRYLPAKAGLIYEVLSDGEILAYSSTQTRSRVSPTYATGNRVFVSSQLGYTFFYDATKATAEGFELSVCVEKHCEFFSRPIKKAKLLERRPMKAVTRCDDMHYLIDLGGETVGLPSLEFLSETEQALTVAWGEHIEDGGVRRVIGGRHFYFEYRATAGKNSFTEYMLRIGCRYLEVFSEAPIVLGYVGVRPQVYETEVRPVHFAKELDRKIYDICVNTLQCCMMEHYVDCPWREQALYAFDSRNQMLCGYFAFRDGNAAYARANLKLIGQDHRAGGLLSICYPCGTKLAIPSFSLYYLIAIKEYLEHTGDTGLAAELLAKMRGILDAFFANSKDGLVQRFEGGELWNFYDWSKFSEGTLGVSESAEADAVINCLFVMALDAFESICGAVGAEFPYFGAAEQLRARIKEAFWCDDSGIFTMRRGREEYTALANALAILAGVVSGADAERVCEALASGRLVDCSLSMKVFAYDALLNTDMAHYRDFVIAEIRKNYGRMLEVGSDTVWETVNGASDFGGAASLCHGWSAIPIYIYHKLGMAK